MTCPLCASQSKLFLANANREYWQCAVCRLIFVPEKFFISAENEVQHYLKHENSLENAGYVQMFKEKIQVVKNVCKRAQTVLDYGCGYEPVLKTLLTQEGFTVTGYDPHFFPQLDLNSTFDLIISTETFEHFKEPSKEIKTIRELLSPGGYMAVMTRQYPEESGEPDLAGFKNWYYQRDPTHICFYSAKTFAWIARSNGFIILYDNGKDFIIFQMSP